MFPLKKLFLREIKAVIADPRRFLFLFGAALAYLFIFGALYSPNLVKNIPTIVFDEDNTKISREFLREFDDSDSFNVIGCAANEEIMLNALREKKALAAIEIPKNFSREIAHGSAEFLYMVNGSNIIVTNVTSSAAQDISANFSDKIASERAALSLGANERDLTKKISPVDVSLRVIGNPIQGYTFFFLIGLAMAAFQQGILFSAGAALINEQNPSRKVFLVKIIFYWLMSMLSFAVILFATENFAEIPLKAPIFDVLILGGAYVFAILGFCALITSFFKREVNFIRAVVMYPVPAFILSGYTFPLESMGAEIQFAAKFFPLTYLSSNVRELFLLGTAPKLFSDMKILILMGVICFVLAIIAKKNRLERRFISPQ